MPAVGAKNIAKLQLGSAIGLGAAAYVLLRLCSIESLLRLPNRHVLIFTGLSTQKT